MTSNRTNLSRRSVLKKGALATGALVIGGTGTAAAGIGDGRVLDYHLNNLHYNVERGEKTRDRVHDASTEKNHGKWEGDGDNPTVDGAVGKAFEFDGNDYIDVNFGDGSEVIIEDWTVAVWINPSDWSEDSRTEWLSVSEDRTDFRPLDFIHESGAVKHYRGDAAGEVMSYDVSGETGWHHTAVTQHRVDSSTVDVDMYFDGNHVDSNSGDYENMRPSVTFFIGTFARPDGKDFYWDGGIDEVRVYDRVLSGEEITDLATMDEE